MRQTNEREQTQQANDDLNARARIRQAALREFAAHGFKGASIRGIARAAEVSPGLVQHHFGTKDGLREACDSWVMEFFRDVQHQFLSGGSPQAPAVTMAQFDQVQPVVDYLITSLSSGSESAARWFREITGYTHEALTSGNLGPPLGPEEDTWAIAATQAAMALGVTAFYQNIKRALNVEDEAEAIVRIGRARLFLASDRVIRPEMREQMERSLDEYEQARSTGKPPPATDRHDTPGTT